MATLYTQQSKNSTKTWLLVGLFLAIIVGIGYFCSIYFGNPAILTIAIIFSIVMNILGYWYSDKIALSLARAQKADPALYKELHQTTENLAITAGLPKPSIWIIEDTAPNAFATGRNKNHASIAVTTGLLALLNKTELEGVIAHELAHIGNKDILLQSMVAILVGFIALIADMVTNSIFFGGFRSRDSEGNNSNAFGIIAIVFIIISPIIATLIQLAISRKREFLADATGALLTRYPEGLASALHKISTYTRPMEHASTATAHMYIANPFGGTGNRIAKLFMTHPPVEERIAALLGKQ